MNSLKIKNGGSFGDDKMQQNSKRKNNDLKADLLCKNLKSGKYKNSFLKIKVDKNGYITDFKREITEDLKGDAENE